MLTFRWGDRGDAELGADIWAESNTVRRGGTPVPSHIFTRVRDSLKDPLSRVGFAEVNGAGVGVLRWSEPWVSEDDHSRIPGICHIGLVFVRPSHWRQGIGRLLVRAAVADAEAQNCEWAQLWTHADNTRSHALYASEDFLPTGDSKLNDLGERMVRFDRVLSPASLRLRPTDPHHDLRGPEKR